MRRAAALLLVLAGMGSPLSAQTFAAADSLLALRDTSGAIAVLEALLKHDRKNAEAHYRVGVLYMSRHVMGSALSPNRRKAENHFRYATRFESDSAKYWLALAEALRTEEVTTTRMQVAGMVKRAREVAREHGRDSLGLVAYRTGRIEWERYEQFAHRYFLRPPEGGAEENPSRLLNMDVMMQDWTYMREFMEQSMWPDPVHPGEANLTDAELALRDALESNPRFVDAAGLLAVALGDASRWEEAYPIARKLVQAAPDSGRAHAVLGMVLARLNRWREAQASFDRALALMTPEQREPYENIGFILRMADSVKLAGQSPAARAVTDSMYWLWNQPLYLHQVNEERVEFYTRLTYVIHRWSDPLRGYQGYESDRGAVYVRWGPPDVWATLGRGATPGSSRDALATLESGRNTVLWVYTPTRLRFAFSLTPGFARAVFARDQRDFYRERNNLPVRFDNVPIVRTLDTIGTQVAQFRAVAPDRSDVVVFAATPTGRMVGASSVEGLQLVTAAILKDRMLRDVSREKREKIVTVEDSLRTDLSTWRVTLTPQAYRLRLEATFDALGRAARSSATLNVRHFTTDSLQLSDVVAAERIAPRDSTAERWTDFLIAPNAGRFPPKVPVALLWEIYNLEPDSTGLVDYQVDIRFTVQEIERHGFTAEFLGFIGDATGLSAKGDDQVTLSFHRRRGAPADGRAVEYLDVDLKNAPEATYLLTVTVRDTHTGRTASVDRWFVVSERPLSR